MSSDLDDYYDNRVKRKRRSRHTYPNKQDDAPCIRYRNRNYSFPSLEDESSEKYIVKEYSHNRLKKEIVISKRTKIHSNKENDEDPDQEQELDSELVAKCLAVVSRKVVRLLCYLGALI